MIFFNVEILHHTQEERGGRRGVRTDAKLIWTDLTRVYWYNHNSHYVLLYRL